ncbi:MAG: response regulator [Gammaproteobacteria bacterium]|nr:MAG: response regulator [Gammaproteobacteria bacterium]
MNAANAQTPVQSQQQPRQQATLLFVDDEANILSSLKRVFRPLGYRIFTALGGAEGLAIMEQENIDLVITDMRMPEMDGAEFLQQATQRWPNTMRILLTGYADLTSTISAVNKGKIYSYISKPWEENDITLQVRHALQQRALEQERRHLVALTRRQNEELKELNTGLEAKVAARTMELQQTASFLELANESLKTSYVTTIKTFVSLIEMREGKGVVAGHSRRVAELTGKLARCLGKTGEGVQDLVYAALLHDIGKIGLPDALVGKAFNAMTPDESKEVRKHPVIGQAVLMALEPLHEAALLIRSHHERYDGQGYPDGLKGEAIPLGARMLSVANDYDALLQGTLVNGCLSDNQARQFLRENSGKRYDRQIVDAFLALLDEEGQESGTQFRQVKTNGLVSGMVLARDLMTEDGILLLSKGYALNEVLIEKIQNAEEAMNGDFIVLIRNT